MDATANGVILELVRGLLEAHDKKSLGAYLKKPDTGASPSGEMTLPELSEEEMAALDDDEMQEA